MSSIFVIHNPQRDDALVAGATYPFQSDDLSSVTAIALSGEQTQVRLDSLPAENIRSLQEYLQLALPGNAAGHTLRIASVQPPGPDAEGRDAPMLMVVSDFRANTNIYIFFDDLYFAKKQL